MIKLNKVYKYHYQKTKSNLTCSVPKIVKKKAQYHEIHKNSKSYPKRSDNDIGASTTSASACSAPSSGVLSPSPSPEEGWLPVGDSCGATFILKAISTLIFLIF